MPAGSLPFPGPVEKGGTADGMVWGIIYVGVYKKDSRRFLGGEKLEKEGGERVTRGAIRMLIRHGTSSKNKRSPEEGEGVCANNYLLQHKNN